MFGSRNENILWMKMGYFRKSFITKCDKTLNFVSLKIGDPIFIRVSHIFVDNVVNFLLFLVNNVSTYFRT